jgi:hypothetical protein
MKNYIPVISIVAFLLMILTIGVAVGEVLDLIFRSL